MAEPIEYRPTRLLRAVAIVCLLVFSGFAHHRIKARLAAGGAR